jgi:phosphate transport system permease protein
MFNPAKLRGVAPSNVSGTAPAISRERVDHREAPATLAPLLKARAGLRIGADRLFEGVLIMCALSSALIVLGIIWVLITQSIPAFAVYGFGFLVTDVWDPVQKQFGIRNFILGTLLVAGLAMLVAGIVGTFTAIYLAEFAPRPVREPAVFVIELLAFIPSVVYGLFGILVFAPWLSQNAEPWLSDHLGFLPVFDGPAFGVGILAAVLILAIMLLPLVVALTRQALIAVPNDQREALWGLGATPWEVVRYAAIPYARAGIAGAIILSLGRALGETIAVAMVIGGSYRLPTSLFDQGYTIASVIANEFTEVSSQVYLSALIEAGLILFILTSAMNVLAHWLIRRSGVGTAGRL